MTLSHLFAFLLGVLALPFLKILRNLAPMTRGTTWETPRERRASRGRSWTTKERRQMLIKDGEL